MGLDAYFCKIPKQRQETSVEDILKTLSSTNNEELKKQLKELKQNCDITEKDFESILAQAIEHYINYEFRDCSSGIEVGYFRKFWWLNDDVFHYTDPYYATNIPVTKEKLEELNTLSKKIIMMVEKHFTDQGWIIETSPIRSDYSTGREGGDTRTYIVFENGVFTEEMENEADEICEKAIPSSDDFLFHKVCDLYTYTKRILKETNFEKYDVVYNANW